MAFATEGRVDELDARIRHIIAAHEAGLRRLDRIEQEGQRQREEAARQREEAAREREEAARERARMNKQWGELTMKMGTFVEDIVAPNIPRLAREHFGLGWVELSGPRLTVRHATDPSRNREFDFIYATPEGWIVNETKSTLRSADVDRFLETIRELPQYFPQFTARPLYPILSSLAVREDVVNLCTRRGIYALAMGDETMEFLNARELRGAPIRPDALK